MASSMDVGDIMSVRYWCQANEQGAVNTFGYLVVTRTGGGATDQQLADLLDLNVGPFYKTILSANSEYRGTQVYFAKRVGSTGLPAPVKAIAQAGSGLGTGDTMPRNAAPVVKYNTTIRGPGGRGRIFLPFVATEYLAIAGEPTAAFDTLVNSQMAGIMAPLTVGTGGDTCTLAWSLLKKHKGTVPTVTGQIVFAESAGRFGTMHKRGDYGRANASPI